MNLLFLVEDLARTLLWLVWLSPVRAAGIVAM
jgi:hypothetical protein